MDLFREVVGSIVYKCLKSVRSVLPLAMYKNRNTGTGNGIRGTRGMVEMLYSGECRQTFRGMSSNILGNVPKHSGEHSSNILHALNSEIQLMLALY